MSYELHGLVGRIEPIAHAAAELGLTPVTLPQGFALLPGPPPDPDAGDPLPSDEHPLWWLTLDLEWAAVAASRIAPVAYLEAEFVGDTGSQAAVVWADGRIALGPLHEDGERSAECRLPLARWPVNQALRELGVVVDPGRDEVRDEFDVLGLGRHPDTESWRDSASA